jgi:DNA-binding XRE family transcriptional regulator
MNPEKYKAERKERGTQAKVAAALEVHQVTIARVETGRFPITRESWLALLSLPKMRNPSEDDESSDRDGGHGWQSSHDDDRHFEG